MTYKLFLHCTDSHIHYYHHHPTSLQTWLHHYTIHTYTLTLTFTFTLTLHYTIHTACSKPTLFHPKSHPTPLLPLSVLTPSVHIHHKSNCLPVHTPPPIQLAIFPFSIAFSVQPYHILPPSKHPLSSFHTTLNNQTQTTANTNQYSTQINKNQHTKNITQTLLPCLAFIQQTPSPENCLPP